MKKIFYSLLLISLLILTGCQQSTDTGVDKTQEFKDRLTKNSWQVEIMGVSGTVTFKENTGIADVEGYGEQSFDYTVSNVSDDGQSATIKITNSGIDEINGQSANAKFVDDGLEVSAYGMSYVLTPV